LQSTVYTRTRRIFVALGFYTAIARIRIVRASGFEVRCITSDELWTRARDQRGIETGLSARVVSSQKDHGKVQLITKPNRTGTNSGSQINGNNISARNKLNRTCKVYKTKSVGDRLCWKSYFSSGRSVTRTGSSQVKSKLFIAYNSQRLDYKIHAIKIHRTLYKNQ